MDRLDRYLVKVARKKSPVGRTGLFRAKYPLPERILGLFESCPEDLVNAGFDEEILWRHDIGWDSEREWITFPIRDLDGQLAGISGRTNDPAMKYKVYRQELRDMGFPGYDIANHDYVWRWDQVYPQVYAADGRPTIYVCEGLKAALWMVQHGYENTVALMGTAMSDTQKVFLERLGGTVIWCLDNDKFGRVATRKNGYKLRGVSQFVMNYPANTKQPDDLASDGLKNAIDTSLRYSRWCARRRKESHYG
jgi:DNA primase